MKTGRGYMSSTSLPSPGAKQNSDRLLLNEYKNCQHYCFFITGFLFVVLFCFVAIPSSYSYKCSVPRPVKSHGKLHVCQPELPVLCF